MAQFVEPVENTLVDARPALITQEPRSERVHNVLLGFGQRSTGYHAKLVHNWFLNAGGVPPILPALNVWLDSTFFQAYVLLVHPRAEPVKLLQLLVNPASKGIIWSLQIRLVQSPLKLSDHTVVSAISEEKIFFVKKAAKFANALQPPPRLANPLIQDILYTLEDM